MTNQTNPYFYTTLILEEDVQTIREKVLEKITFFKYIFFKSMLNIHIHQYGYHKNRYVLRTVVQNFNKIYQVTFQDPDRNKRFPIGRNIKISTYLLSKKLIFPTYEPITVPHTVNLSHGDTSGYPYNIPGSCTHHTYEGPYGAWIQDFNLSQSQASFIGALDTGF